MHRQTPYDIAFRGYSSGGARSCIDKVDDGPLMQESNDAHGMDSETFPTAEAPQNYGFTSVVADATKSAAGKIAQCAEGFMSFIGGNRNFPVMGMMDDRRHRLKNLAKDAAKGATAMFGQKDWGQQFLNTEDGMYMTGNNQKKIRMALVDNQNGKTQQQQPPASAGNTPATIAAAAARVRANGRGDAGLLQPVIFKTNSGVEFEIEVVPWYAEAAMRNLEVAALADGGGGNGGGGNGGQPQGGHEDSKPTGQKTLHKEDSSVWIEQNGKDTQSTHGDANSRQRAGSDSTVFYGEDNSCQSTKDHSHIMSGVHIWVAGGCFSDMPIIIKRDGLCKGRTKDPAPQKDGTDGAPQSLPW
jgi:phage gp45-like